MGSGCTARVDGIMTRGHLLPDTRSAARRLADDGKRGLQRVPVLDKARRPLGIICAGRPTGSADRIGERRRVASRLYIRDRVSVTEQTSPSAALLTDACLRPCKPMSEGVVMPRQKASSKTSQRQQALSRWDNEGGAGPAVAPAPDKEQIPAPEMSNSDLVTLRVRVIALENSTDLLACHGVGPATRTRARNGGLHLAEAGLYPSSAHDTRRSPHDRPHRAVVPLPMTLKRNSERRRCAIRLSRQELAEMVDPSIYTVSRTFTLSTGRIAR